MKTEYTIEEILKATGGNLLFKAAGAYPVQELLLDSRKVIHPTTSIFFALSGLKLDGHHYIDELYRKGVRNFVVSNPNDITAGKYPDSNFIQVKDTRLALQKLAARHRSRFSLPVIAITGSNGKTIVKEWLYQLLHEDYNIVRSPKSYNSQTGVPLSLWQINETHDLGIFEAGISEPGEMERLEKIIKPNIGVFTNVGEAHSEGFLSTRHKTKEKLNLFVNADILIYCKDYFDINQSVAEINALSKGTDETESKIKTLTWSMSSEADVQVTSVMQNENRSYITCFYKNKDIDFEIPFVDKASVENAIHCACVMLYLKRDAAIIKERMKHLSGIKMRLEMKDAVNNCSLINDSYNSDTGSLKIAIDFLVQQNQHPKKTVILSDILQTGRGEFDLYSEVAALLKENKIDRFIGIGPGLVRSKKIFEKNEELKVECYETTEEYIKHFDPVLFQNEVILLKGARKYRFEIIGKFLEKKAHETVLEINLNAISHNLKVYQSLLRPETKIMVMVKAFSYGAGSFEIANVLQFSRADYLAVAYADEGVELRKNGITLPIMVMNPEVRSFEAMIQYGLEPEIYSLAMFDRFAEVLTILRNGSADKYKIHIELETGMNRLGFVAEEIPLLIEKLKLTPQVQVASVFSHLAASEDKEYDVFTKEQIKTFDIMSSQICAEFEHKILRHILNSNGITRHTKAQFDMVRLGIGLYGLDSSEKVQNKLMNVSALKTTISQIKEVKAGNTVGYGRVGKVQKDKVIATVGLGYADGLSRKLSNGKGKMLVNGKLAPIIGNVCMDMAMLDITGIDAREGDEVTVFGISPRIEDLAEAAGTIPYEILTGISGRVKRIYFQE
ncbi:MAG TPA: bifunctional UDP-N-acetylmuramoyl-tripeptide:D-alanyl-D-alanine ligase/alanine racemase [Chitinophagales bacterium]|nr:bifunctional UDP-N-acetylmuramoyl-tripeptide:D-alanyl-D-alanine ligase/alanine racemase [Chitinophagales bacterium]